jgi:Asp-tRNA(Asn)/Glu-tRNA(Gln) amidotransferase A subunit family amidase
MAETPASIPQPSSSSTTTSTYTPPQFFNYPEPHYLEVTYKAPAANSNPIFRGLPLLIGSKIIANAPFIAKFLWANAGFNTLRGLKEVDGVEARYEPVVIPVKSAEDYAAQNYTAADALRDTPGGTPTKDEVVGRFWSVKDYHDAYTSGKLTPTDVVKALLPLIRRDVKDKTQHSTAFLCTNVEAVLAAAEASTQRWKAGAPLGTLDGIPIAVKDEVDAEGYCRTFASCREYKSAADTTESSWCVRQWLEAGAILVGKTNMHEIGMDTTNNNPVAGTPLNPYNPQYYTGGSSGGSAYAVGAGLVPFALGCDGGGSIRLPASFCGIYGLKTSHARVSERPTPNLACTNTVVGPMAADMSSLELAYRVMATPDPSHRHSALFPPPRKIASPPPKVLGVYKNWFDRADPAVKALCQRAIDHFVEKLGYELVDVHIPLIHEGQTAHALSIMSEAVNGTPDTTFLTPANRVLLSVGAQCPVSDFIQANRVRNLLMSHLAALYKQYPGLLILTPTVPTAGWEIKGGAGDLTHGVSDGDMSIRSMEYVWLANFSGCPCLQVPVGYAKPKDGYGEDVVPVGMMAMGEWGSEDRLVEWGFEAEAYLHGKGGERRRRPPVWVDVLGRAGRGEGGEEDGKVTP